ncbi:MAG TPA: 3'-5' exonuclease [Aggregatilineales bacterium]|nr:3'-5' exonuclease [Aggregatilineales bacterium]
MLKHDQLIIVDVEATCWKDRTAPPGQQSEIIEIGVCLLDLESFTRSEKRSILVRPERSSVSEFCTQLTTLTQEQVDTGISFADACAMLVLDFGSENRIWGSWGNYDRKMFEYQCASFAANYPFSDTHINIKAWMADLKNTRQMGLAAALRHLNLAMEGTHHRGDDDAWNIAQVMSVLLESHGLDAFFEYLKG